MWGRKKCLRRDKKCVIIQKVLTFNLGKEGSPIKILVHDNNVEQALRVMKKKLQREGSFREMKLRRYYEKPSEKRVREKTECIRRARKMARKRFFAEGF